MYKLWELIQNKAEAIEQSYRFLESGFAQATESEAVVATVQRIISEERDHMDALMYLYESAEKNKAATDITQFAQHALLDYRDKIKLIK